VLHQATEDQAGVPGSINSTADYALLLRHMLEFHSAAESAFHDPRWTAEWVEIGIEIASHDRIGLIEEDLRVLGGDPGARDRPDSVLTLSTFAEVLGCLYVVEGSSLGGRFIAPIILEKLGQVPTSYYEGTGRGHPSPWRSVKAALGRYDETHDNCDAVVSGAIATFTFFGHLSTPEVLFDESV
jgi:heme oxygenase